MSHLLDYLLSGAVRPQATSFREAYANDRWEAPVDDWYSQRPNQDDVRPEEISLATTLRLYQQGRDTAAAEAPLLEQKMQVMMMEGASPFMPGENYGQAGEYLGLITPGLMVEHVYSSFMIRGGLNARLLMHYPGEELDALQQWRYVFRDGMGVLGIVRCDSHRVIHELLTGPKRWNKAARDWEPMQRENDRARHPMDDPGWLYRRR